MSAHVHADLIEPRVAGPHESIAHIHQSFGCAAPVFEKVITDPHHSRAGEFRFDAVDLPPFHSSKRDDGFEGGTRRVFSDHGTVKEGSIFVVGKGAVFFRRNSTDEKVRIKGRIGC